MLGLHQVVLQQEKGREREGVREGEGGRQMRGREREGEEGRDREGEEGREGG